jgi:drug/metabolite transporter (DMT)-like permease
MPITNKLNRREIIENIRQQLLIGSRPRVYMSLILIITGLIGFLISYCLLHVGITSMQVRYPLVVLSSYGVFLLLLRIWLKFHQTSRSSIIREVDIVDVDLLDIEGEVSNFGRVGDIAEASLGDITEVGSSNGPSSIVDGLNFDIDLDEGCLIIAVFILILGGIVASLYLIYIAPILMAELLVDGLLASSLYRRVRDIDRVHWLRSVINRTIIPVIITTLFLLAFGYLMHIIAPEAQTIGQVFHHLSNQ